MKKILWLLSVSLLVCLTACTSFSANPQNTEDQPFTILWVGDESLTFVPMQTLLLLSEGGQVPINLKNETLINDRYSLSAGEVLQALQDYPEFEAVDLLVLQTFSAGENPPNENIQTNLKVLLEDIAPFDIDLLLFFPQRVPGQEENAYQNLVEQSLQAAWANQIPLAPIGEVWQGLETNPEISLTVDSPTHLSPAGVYLNASVFYSVFRGNSAVNTPVKTSIGFGQPDTIIMLDDAVINQLNEAVWQVLEGYQRQGEFITIYPLQIIP